MKGIILAGDREQGFILQRWGYLSSYFQFMISL